MALLDQYGKPIRPKELLTMKAQAGLTGVRHAWAGSVASGLTPQKLAGLLRACDEGQLDEFLVLAEEMEERDPHYLSVLGTRKRVISSVTPTVKPASDSPRDKDIAAAVEKHIANHDGFYALVEDMLDALGKSFSVVEIDWKKTSSLWTFNEFVHVDPRFFVFDRETGRQIRLKDEADPVNGVDLEPFKFITHRAKLKSGLTYRGGLARFVAFGWMCKQYDFKDWMAFVETYGLPIRLGRYEQGASKADVAELFRAVANVGTDAAAVLSKSMMIEFVNMPTANGDKIFENLARFIDEQTSKAVLGQTMTADSGSSEAQANVHNEVRHDIAASDAKGITSTLNRDLVKPFVDLNFGVPIGKDGEPAYPRLEIRVDEPEDTKAKITGAVALARIGVKFKASELRATAGYSDPEEGDEVVGGTMMPPASSAPPLATNRMAVDNTTALPGENALGEVEAEMLSDWEEVAGVMEAAIATAVEGAESYEDLLKALPETLRHMPTSLVVNALVKGMFNARVIGDQRDG
jgi:phage gp29-like protein